MQERGETVEERQVITMDEFEKAAYRPRFHLLRAQSPPPESFLRINSPLSRSISPAPRPKSILRLPIPPHCEGSSTDRGVVPHWEVPTTREELLERYFVRNCETQPSPPRTRFLSYRLDAAALLVGRLAKHLGKVVEKWKQNTKEARDKRKRRALGSSLSLQFLPILGTESTESDTFEGWRSQTPVSLLSRRAWQQQRAFERVYSVLSILISHRLRLLWTISKPLLTRESVALQVFAILENCLYDRLQVFFTHELFEIPTEEYKSFRLMIKGVNRMVGILCKVVIRDAYEQLRTANYSENIEIGLCRLGKFVRKRVKEDFNRLRFFAEILEEVRRKTKRRQALRRPLQLLFSLLSAQIANCHMIGFANIHAAAARRVFLLSSRKAPLRVMLKIINNCMIFRIKTAFCLWANANSYSLSSTNSPLTQLIEKQITRILLASAWKCIRARASMEVGRKRPKAICLLALTLSEKVISRVVFAWTRLQSCLRPFVYFRRFITTVLNRRLSQAFHSLLSPAKSLVPSNLSLLAR